MVFDGYLTGGSSGYDETYLEHTSDGDYKFHTYTTGQSDSTVAIQSYKPGNWENHLTHLLNEAKEKKKRKEKTKIEQDIEESKKKFGL
jgi:hypothetical protein